MKMIPGQTPYTPEQERRLNRMLADACEAEELVPLDELEERAHRTRMLEVRIAVTTLNRQRCVELLEAVSIQCYDHETVEVLREAVLVNVEDGTIEPRKLLED